MNFLRRLFGGYSDKEPEPKPVSLNLNLPPRALTEPREKADPLARQTEELLAEYRRKKTEIASKLGVTVEEYDAAVADDHDTITLAPLADGDDPHNIVGEAHYQDALASIAGPKSADGADEWITAELIPEPGNPYDPKAIAVMIDGEKVGYLSRQDAPLLSRLLKAAGADRAECDGTIEGGWKNARSEGSYCVRLDIEWPPRAAD